MEKVKGLYHYLKLC